MKRSIQLVFLTLTLLSCSTKRSLLKKNYEITKIGIYGKVNDIEIYDRRENITDRRLKIPMISLPGQLDRVNPFLTQPQKDSITNQIISYFVSGDDTFSIKVEVLEGVKEFTAHTFHEREFVQFDTKIKLSNLSNNGEKTCSSTAFFEAKSMDASNSFIDKLYAKAMRTSIYKCFEKIIE